jgi:hypothetical protein
MLFPFFLSFFVGNHRHQGYCRRAEVMTPVVARQPPLSTHFLVML